jgi:hypothetical protein
MANQINGDEKMLSKASELYSEIKDATDMDEVHPDALEEYLEMVDEYITYIRGHNFSTDRDDGLTKEGMLIDLENMRDRINGLLASGGRRRSRRSRKSRSRKAYRKGRSRKNYRKGRSRRANRSSRK